MPSVYTVNYPDGRRLSFFKHERRLDDARGHGVSDRFQKPNSDYMIAICFCPTAARYGFAVQIQRFGDDFGPVTISCDFTFMGIIDPYGRRRRLAIPAMEV